MSSLPTCTRRLAATVAVAIVAGSLALTSSVAWASGTAIGSLDPSFGAGGGVRIGNPDGDPSLTVDVHALADGRVLVLLPGEPTSVLRYLADGSLDPSFGGDGRVELDPELRADAFTVDPSGRVLLVGTRLGADGDHDVAITRLFPGGGVDRDYGSGGVALIQTRAISERGCGAAITAAGRLVVAAAGVHPGPTDDPADDRTLATFLQLGNRGRLTTEFGGDGIVRLDSTAARCDLFPQPDGSLVFGGPSQGPAWFGSRCAVGRLLPGGRPDPDFHGDGVRALVPTTGSASRCATTVQPDGKIVAALRTAKTRSTGFDVELIRVRPGGSIDTSFGRRGHVTVDLFGSDDTPVALVADVDGITIGTTSAGIGREHDVALARVRLDGTTARAFGVGGRLGLDVGQALGGRIGDDRLVDLAGVGDGLAVLGVGPRPARVRGLFRLGPHDLDRELPSTEISHPADGRTYGQLGVQAFRGSASDALSGVVRVEVALRQTLANGRCRWLGRRGGFDAGGCDRPGWLRADGTFSWLFELPRVLPESVGAIASYRAYARAFDGAGNVERRFQRGRNANTFEVRN
jgi:uncharacterized delta-60 repeat protein